MKTLQTILAMLIAAAAFTGGLEAQVPPLINYQGRVAVGPVNFEGAGLFKFALVNSDGTITFWSNDGTSTVGDEPTAAVSLAVAKGLYSVLLGDAALANMTAIPAGVFANPDVRLRVWFDDGVIGSQLLSPDQRLAPSAYLSDGTVTTAAIADAAIVAAKIAPAAIDGTHVAAGSLDFSHLTVPAAPGAGQVLGFNGTTLAWTAPGAGDGIWTLAGALAYRLGDVAIGTNAADPNYRLKIEGNVQFVKPGLGGTTTMQIGSPNGEIGMTITDPVGRADYRFDGTALKIVAGTAGFVPSPLNGGLTIHRNGRVGLGTDNPQRKLHLRDAVGVAALVETLGGTNVETQVRFKNAAGEWAIGTSRDFNNNQFYVAREGGPVLFSVETNGGAIALGDLTGTRLWLRPDPAAPTNAAVLCGAAGTTNFIPYNTALNRAMDLIVRDATVRQITITGGADLAEPFMMKEEGIEPGAVVVIDDEHPGRLRRSTQAYDSRVAGIVSGAGGVQPGIALRQEGVIDGGQNVALSGRVYVNADASYGAIRPGDLLTTSETPGHAMKATDRERTPGAVLGKAMTRLDEGQGEVLVLVTLQ